jgi:hypothetical protein
MERFIFNTIDTQSVAEATTLVGQRPLDRDDLSTYGISSCPRAKLAWEVGHELIRLWGLLVSGDIVAGSIYKMAVEPSA